MTEAAGILLIVVYRFPAIVAGIGRHHQEWAIGVLNLLLGCTVLGWMIAMVWACTATKNAKE